MAPLSRSFPLLPGESQSTPTESVALCHRAPRLWIGVEVLDWAEGAAPEHGAAPSDSTDRTTRAALAALAFAARDLTPLVCMEPPDGLLLEVHGSLKLFGGLAEIKKKLVAELDRRRLRYHLCVAPTPLAAAWLARCAAEDVLESSALPGRLSQLSLAATRWPDRSARRSAPSPAPRE